MTSFTGSRPDLMSKALESLVVTANAVRRSRRRRRRIVCSSRHVLVDGSQQRLAAKHQLHQLVSREGCADDFLGLHFQKSRRRTGS